MDKVKLEDFRCINSMATAAYAACGKIPNPGDKIYSCNFCPKGQKYRCETCFTKNVAIGHGHGFKNNYGQQIITLI